jgi:hypothetical protein
MMLCIMRIARQFDATRMKRTPGSTLRVRIRKPADGGRQADDPFNPPYRHRQPATDLATCCDVLRPKTTDDRDR